MEGTSFDGLCMREQMEWAKKVLSEQKSKNIVVKHLEGSSKYQPKNGGTWKDFWLKNANERKFPIDETKCLSCGNPTKANDFVGGHIVEVANPNKMYICPVCRSCNSTYGEGKESSPEFQVTKNDCVDFTFSDAIERHDESEQECH